ncbi:tRNA 2-thiouridine synthesizing protein B [Pseudomonas sp. B10]|jgi:tRNA 2-thiouridine synthesizing protein B|uniref:Sulfurtransferase complex subunit TusB n=1 Tax=Pseudomonas siliginis TaxID=2842346 RepID=A0ABY5CAH7_9PSED|nr:MULTISPECIES: sulfurtransferase complex subunit TusB [Pseudomonas]KQT63496.1 sulfur relay protein DsrH [Pseudomonas sp. Leaf434]MEB2652777.1 sulfurtransferase complex subunit TusB [Pseudomonas siliginis]UST72555.1 sulfurtransferase complex subunit TusB [Pseudomonas siliginis]UST77822.1 sulfurtransferase complex subunit TusB [Pseudomonas siliginis]UST83099.1 sulfurtransferase complex subunit TusB [Pseudomonas siliginis]
MSTLHVLSHSPFGDDRLSSCLRLLGSADAVLLSGDAVYALQPDTVPFSTLQERAIRLFVLIEDAQARAIEIPDWAEAIDYPAFVELSIHHAKVNSWL